MSGLTRTVLLYVAILATTTLLYAHAAPAVSPLLEAHDPDEAEEDPCSADTDDVYNQGLHIGGVFIILGASVIGAGLPLLGKYVPMFALHPFLLVCGKCMGIGIILACALIHMLQPASEALTNECLSKAFTEDYGAYAFLFCMLAIFMMQFIDFMVEAILIERLEAKLDLTPNATQPQPNALKNDDNKNANAIVKAIETPSDAASSTPPVDSHHLVICVGDHPGESTDVNQVCVRSVEDCHDKVDTTEVSRSTDMPRFHIVDHDEDATNDTLHYDLETIDTKKSTHDHVGHGHHGHSHGHSHAHGEAHGHIHSVLLIKGLKRTISAYLLEFGVTAHSVLVGITVGVVNEHDFHALLIALVFHQCFEGVALGSRIVEADLGNRLEECIMVAMFAFSAPIGIAVGIGITASINTNGPVYNYTSGVFDGVCAGILLYIGLLMLVKDFPEDMRHYCKKNKWYKFCMFASMWVGGGVMAFIGRYL